MEDKPQSRSQSFESFVPWPVLAILLIYTYASFIQVPYIGFDFNPTDGRVGDVFVKTSPNAALHSSDILLQVGSIRWSDYRASSRQGLFTGVKAGEVVPLIIQRGDERLTIPWQIPGINLKELLERIINAWIVGYVFWLAGVTTMLFVRPKDTRRLLLIAIFFLTAIWVVSGNVSRWHIWESAIVMRSAMWLWVAVCLHLHWSLPETLRKIPAWLLWVFYLAFAGLAVSEWFQLLPRSAYSLGFLLAASASVLLMVFRIIFRPSERRKLGLLATAISVAIMPSLAINLSRLFASTPYAGGGALLALPVIPVAYFYTINQRQLGSMEVRANRLISVYLFLILLGSALAILFPLVDGQMKFPHNDILIGVLSAMLVGIITPFIYPRFERFVEYHLLDIPIPPTHLLETYSARITTSLDADALISLLKEEMLPSLLIRESALLRILMESYVTPLYGRSGDQELFPMKVDIQALLARSGRYLFDPAAAGGATLFPWANVVLPLRVSGKLLGFWLLGHRDPDDYYSQADISILQTIANQTAIAIVNISQREQLHALFQANIEQHEQERTRLARDLHDDVLNQLAVLAMNVDQFSSPSFAEHYDDLTSHLRQMISGLRPAMLNYGLRAALEELVDELVDRATPDDQAEPEIDVTLDIPPSELRYDLRVEEQLYRIVQQAGENALKHAQATHIRIWGCFEPGRICLNIQDDGEGFPSPEELNLDQLLASQHFGLVGMYERAALINAHLTISSGQEQGTTVSVEWREEVTRQVVDQAR